MNILFIAHRFPPHLGGTPGRVFRLSKGLSLKGHEVTVYTSTHPSVPRVQEFEGIRVVRHDLLHPAITRFLKPPYYIMPGMFKDCSREEFKKVEIVQTFHFLSYVSFLGACAKLLHRIPFALSPLIMHHHMVKEGLRTAYRKKGLRTFLSESYLISYFLSMGKYTLKTADFLAPQTTSEENTLITYGVNPGKVRVIPGSIEVERYRKLTDRSLFRKEHSIGPDEKLILFVGTPNYWKGLHHLILAMKNVMTKVNKARLVLVGPSANKANNELRRLGSSAVKSQTLITGPLVGENLVAAYSASDIFILPSRAERFGTVIVEALASGLPVISTRTGIAPDLIHHGENGLFIEFGKVQEISEAIIRIVLDENFKEEAEKNRQSILKTFSSHREIESYENAYRNIIR